MSLKEDILRRKQTCAMATNQGPRSSKSREKYTFQDPGFPMSHIQYTCQDPGSQGPTSSISLWSTVEHGNPSARARRA